MKEFLKKMIAAKEKRAAEIRELVKGSEDVNEVRALGVELESVNAELSEARHDPPGHWSGTADPWLQNAPQ